jgi:pimeloyl-ACP methyl ester carboxylesterase
MAGLTLPRVAGARPDVLAGLVFVSCTVPAHGQTCIEATAAEVREELDLSDGAGADGADVPGEDFFRRAFGNDLDDEGFAAMMSHMVGEALAVIEEPVDLSGLEHPIPRTWVRLTRDGICTPARQDVFIANLGGAEVIELDAGHMAMFSRPADLAAILDDVADRHAAT